MEIKNITLYDRELIIKYNKHYLVDFIKRNFLYLTAVVIGFAIYFISIGDWMSALLVIGVLILYLILTVIIQVIATLRVLKKSPIVQNPVYYEYTFSDVSIKVKSRTTIELTYNQIMRVSSGRNFYVIYDISKKPYIVDIEKFHNHDEKEEVKRLLQSKIGKRFK
jgi:hypothetical protein